MNQDSDVIYNARAKTPRGAPRRDELVVETEAVTHDAQLLVVYA